ncbi:hypothetical protein OPV22_024926 [Ensete ventricosum]|uniref:Uncharacterized protein n=1 Tax=Ensete ventricosum TaxID=4639 RepID=A0AAV8QCB4_ENSVE|nr:hypothetical protein OPV22_024926 [Ensete ventricosum]
MGRSCRDLWMEGALGSSSLPSSAVASPRLRKTITSPHSSFDGGIIDAPAYSAKVLLLTGNNLWLTDSFETMEADDFSTAFFTLVHKIHHEMVQFLDPSAVIGEEAKFRILKHRESKLIG